MSRYAQKWAVKQHPLKIDEDGNPIADTRNPGAKAVLNALAVFAPDGRRDCYPCQNTIAQMTDYSVRSVRKFMRDLECQGLIARTERYREGGGRTSDHVTLLGPIAAFGPTPKPAETTQTKAERGAGPPPEAASAPPRNVVPGIECKEGITKEDNLPGRQNEQSPLAPPIPIRRGRQPATPQPVIDYMSSQERRDLNRFVRVAERYDFRLSDTDPPDWKIMNELGGTKGEQAAWLERLGGLTRRIMKELEGADVEAM
jgi:hypothetical protein